jgi:hypothetical protein
MFFIRRKTKQHIIDGAKQAWLNYRIHLIELSTYPVGYENMCDDNGNPIEWTQDALDTNAAEIVKVDAELAKF